MPSSRLPEHSALEGCAVADSIAALEYDTSMIAFRNQKPSDPWTKLPGTLRVTCRLEEECEWVAMPVDRV